MAAHLAHNYGDKALSVAAIALSDDVTNASPSASSASSASSTTASPLSSRLAHGYPFVEAEVVYAVQHEYAETAVDVLAHRTRLAFLNSDAAWSALPRVVQLMSELKRWDTARAAAEWHRGLRFLQSMNRGLSAALPEANAAASASASASASPSPAAARALELQPFMHNAHHLPYASFRL